MVTERNENSRNREKSELIKRASTVVPPIRNDIDGTLHKKIFETIGSPKTMSAQPKTSVEVSLIIIN
jgi:hypothetical protein